MLAYSTYWWIFMWFPPFATNAVMNKHARARTHTHHCTRTSTPIVSRVRENTEVKGTHTGTSGIWYTPTCGLRVCQFPTGGGSSYPNFTERGNLSESKPEWLQNPSSLWINWGTRYKTDTQSRRRSERLVRDQVPQGRTFMEPHPHLVAT